jgi:hypothetical protein
LIQVPDVRGEAAKAAGQSRAPLATNDDVRERFQEFVAATPAVEAAIAPFAECAGCEHRCQFRGRSATAVRLAPVENLRSRIKAYPKTAVDRREWWTETIKQTRGLAAQVPLRDATPDEQRDFEACVFVHLGRRAFRQGMLGWTRLYRKYAAAGVGR